MNADFALVQSAIPVKSPSKNEKYQPLTFRLLQERHASVLKTGGENADDISAKLLSLSRIRLDRAQLMSIDGIEMWLAGGPGQCVTHLYLHRNAIQDISPLAYIPTLRFLILSHNHIKEISSTFHRLTELGLLDVSHNRIEHLDSKALPPNLTYLYTNHNPCEKNMAERDAVKEQLIGTLAEWDDEIIMESESESETDTAKTSTTNFQSRWTNVKVKSVETPADNDDTTEYEEYKENGNPEASAILQRVVSDMIRRSQTRQNEINNDIQ